MLLMAGLVIFLIGCIVSAVDDYSNSSQRMAERRHRELMRYLADMNKKQEVEEEEEELSPTLKRVIRRRIAQDKEGNVLAEEITEETK